MNKKISIFSCLGLILCSQLSYADLDKTQLAVWANEAIIATFSYDSKNYLQEQKEIAKYFTSDGWIAYTKAQSDSKVPDLVKKNNYFVSAVATMPPELKAVSATYWQASMPVLVLYKNESSQQKQNLQVIITFSKAPGSQGVRGYTINSLQSAVITPPCQCNP